MAASTVNLVEHPSQICGAKMDPLIGAALIGGGSNLLGGGLSFLGAQNANAQNNALAWTQRFDQMNQFDQQMRFAREQFFTGSFVDIQNRINAAKAFGVSPLAALGGASFSPTPIPVGTISGGGGNSVNEFAGMGTALGNIGQDISRAVAATRTDEEKALMAAQTANYARQAARTDAEVNMLNAQANYYNARAAGTPSFPAVVSDTGYVVQGQGNTTTFASGVGANVGGNIGGYVNKAPEILTHQPGNQGVVSGRPSPADQYYWTKGGELEVQPSTGSPASQGDIFNSTLNFMRNRLGHLGPKHAYGDSDPNIFAVIKSRYPDAVGYQRTGFGYYRPIFPDEHVRHDVRVERIQRR